MTGGVEYKIWLDGKVVDSQFYTMIETVTVEQGIDLATEARIEVEMCMNDKGEWTGPSKAYAKPWQRLRIEVRNQTSTWVPLIDGPVVSWDAATSGEPGQSVFTIVAHDDTVRLNTQAKYEIFEGQTDTQVMRTLFQNRGISDLDIEDPPDLPSDRPLKHIKRGTEMDMLRSIAEPYDLHVYVVPGDVGKSKGCVKRLATKASGLPVLVLAGADRNVEQFQARNDVARATRYQSIPLDLDDPKNLKDPLSSQWSDTDTKATYGGPTRTGSSVALLGKVTTVEDLKTLGYELLPPEVAAFRDVSKLVERWQQKSSYTITATGSVRYGCYNGVLRAYDVVGASGVPERLCTNFIVREVTHTLTRSEYRQDFTLMTNATAQVQKGGGAVPSSVI
jgi:hypothetical protein